MKRVIVKSNGEYQHEVLADNNCVGCYKTEQEAEKEARDYARRNKLNYGGVEYHPTVTFSYEEVIASTRR